MANNIISLCKWTTENLEAAQLTDLWKNMHACMHACIHTYIHTYIYNELTRTYRNTVVL